MLKKFNNSILTPNVPTIQLKQNVSKAYFDKNPTAYLAISILRHLLFVKHFFIFNEKE